jgi:hypothetical protein
MSRRAVFGRFLVTWLRLLVLALSIHISVVAFAAITDDPCADDSGCCSDCPVEKSGQECPPGCPNCHCHHTGGAVAVSEVDGEELSPPARDQGTAVGHLREAKVPCGPSPSSIYRPPRMRSSLT